MRSSLMLTSATRILIPLLLLYAFFLLWRGHNAPGGGFVGGLIAASAFVLYTLTAGVAAGRRALVDPSSLLSGGLAVALISGVPALFQGQPFMTAVWTTLHVGSIELALGTPLLFDVGVFLAVTGVVLTIVFTLAETAFSEAD